MAEALILDSEAINALANPTERAALFDRARAILTLAHERRALVRVPAPVLAEVYRGKGRDAALDRLLNSGGIRVSDLTRAIARTGGQLLAKNKLASSHAVDAFVVATALTFERAIIATVDPKDMARLVANARQVRIFPL